MKYKEFVERVNKLMDNIYPHEVTYPLKRYNVKRVRAIHIPLVKACVILSRIGLPISSKLILDITEGFDVKDSRKVSMQMMLAKLGDKRVLYLLGYGAYGMLLYTINRDFSELLRIDYKPIDELKDIIAIDGVDMTR